MNLRPCKRSLWAASTLAAAGMVVAAAPDLVLNALLVMAAGTQQWVATLTSPVRLVGMAGIAYGLVVGQDVSETYGIISKRRRSTRLEHIRRSGVEQPVIGWLLGYGAAFARSPLVISILRVRESLPLKGVASAVPIEPPLGKSCLRLLGFVRP